MSETYVICIGGKPWKVTHDRTQALSTLTEGFRLSPREMKQVAVAQAIGLELHRPLLVVGYDQGGGGGWCKDRSLTRVE